MTFILDCCIQEWGFTSDRSLFQFISINFKLLELSLLETGSEAAGMIIDRLQQVERCFHQN